MIIDNTDQIIDKIRAAVKKSLKEMGIVGVAEVKANCPVNKGKLRGSYTYIAENFSVEIGTKLDYAIYVEFKPSNRGGRPHFRRSMESQIGEFKAILERNLGGV
ncbi:HK97 gp10 family phage protein [Paraclostridium bifermentans]|uniref:HK97 gp10 family phage protein n=1 Tax=Paraclostridium bifermentans TaxID=1490 RepID=UPI00290FF011|nr:HK97 gp10 family phage protein [Paraclostridium bifermentans]MDU3337955.1 HK97 gp10 family phage protein [Paraclostridium bifermentans]